MAKIPETYEYGPVEDMSQEELLRYIQQMYTQLAIAINRKPDIIQRTVNGQTTDSFLSNGDININLSTNAVQMLTNHVSPTVVTWTTLS